jgi:chromosome segregation ATPase
MDQDPRTAGPQVGAREAPEDQQRTPEEIRADIAQTREEVGDTVEALAAKTDVKAQAQNKIDEIKSNVRAKTDELGAKAKDSTPGGAQQGGRQVVELARANPAPVAIAGAVLFGFFLSRLTDRRR